MQFNSMAVSVGDLLKENNQTVSVSESSAGGLISAALLSVSGASSYFVGGGVIYTRQARRVLIGAPENVVTMRASTEEFALIMGRLTREKLNTDWGLCETGASGPTGNRYGDAAGHCCIAVSGPVEASITLETGSNDREANMQEFAASAIQFLDQVVRDYHCSKND